jgi:uncharacterized membrane protein (DUF373 family)
MINYIFSTDFLALYLVAGLVITAVTDIAIRNAQSSAPFTFSEILACILFWPLVLVKLSTTSANNDF